MSQFEMLEMVESEMWFLRDRLGRLGQIRAEIKKAIDAAHAPSAHCEAGRQKSQEKSPLDEGV